MQACATHTYVHMGVGTGPVDPAAAGPKFAEEIETHNSKISTVWKVLNY